MSNNQEPLSTTADILIMGIGNLLMSDEGLGIHFVRKLEKEPLPSGVDLLDGGTAGFLLMEYFEKYQDIILIDATLDSHPPGNIRRLKPQFSTDFPKAMSTHEIGLKDLMDGMYLLGKQPNIHLFVVSIATLQPMDMTLSPAVEKALDELKKQVFDQINSIQKERPL
jgi:hydrogenase maturation protease